jgi:hypothetical protein
LVWSYHAIEAWKFEIIRYIYVPPERVSPVEFADDAMSTLGRIKSLDLKALADSSALKSTLCDMQKMADTVLHNQHSMALWVSYIERKRGADSFSVEIVQPNKDILDWKFLPEKKVALDTSGVGSPVGTDVLRFFVLSPRIGERIAVAIIQQRATQGPLGVRFDPKMPGAIPLGTDLPLWYRTVWYVGVFLLGLILGLICSRMAWKAYLWVITSLEEAK